MAVSAEAARVAEGKLRDAFNGFKKVLSSTVETFKPGLTRTEESIDFDYWRKEINTPGVVDELQRLYEKGTPESERVYITPELHNHIEIASEAIRSNSAVQNPTEYYGTLLRLAERARQNPQAAKAAAVAELKKRVGPAVPERALELLLDGKKNDLAHSIRPVAKRSAEDVAKAQQIESQRAATLARAEQSAIQDAVAQLKKTLSPLFPADALELVVRNNRTAIAERPDFALIRAETESKKTDVARIITQTRLAVLDADRKVDADIAKALKEPAGTKTAELEATARDMLPKSGETAFLTSVLDELSREDAGSLLSGAIPRLSTARLAEMAKAAGVSELATLFERSIQREGEERKFEQHIGALKNAFVSFKPFEEMTVAEVFAEHPEWETEIEEDLRKHKWGEE